MKVEKATRREEGVGEGRRKGWGARDEKRKRRRGLMRKGRGRR